MGIGDEWCVSVCVKLHCILNSLELSIYCLCGVDTLLHVCPVVMHIGGGDVSVAPHQVPNQFPGRRAQIPCVELLIIRKEELFDRINDEPLEFRVNVDVVLVEFYPHFVPVAFCCALRHQCHPWVFLDRP